MAQTFEQPQENVIHAEPTKDFFISMLVRDISLNAAIIDLVDNCVDGARRLRAAELTAVAEKADSGNSRPLDGLEVLVSLNSDEFRIKDNCGGIPWGVAHEYAFRFGRPDGAEQTKKSIGQFGIGMKRALFKLGSAFSVSSQTSDDSFVLRVDVEDWRKSDSWTFDQLTRSTSPAEPGVPLGTDIRVNGLHEATSGLFDFESFVSALSKDISKAHQSSMALGLSITLNGIPVGFTKLALLESDELKVGYSEAVYDSDTEDPVTAKYYVGVDDSSPKDAGWYVYCNGRLIVGPDRTELTGWGTGGASRVPRFHNQFARFRGYVFFESGDADKLPWTTTKDDLDPDHRFYKVGLTNMAETMRPVIDFLNRLEAEKNTGEEDDDSLELTIARAEARPRIALSRVQVPTSFQSPARVAVRPRPSTQSIQYRKDISLIEEVKEALGASSAKEAGERTFDYFVEREIDNG